MKNPIKEVYYYYRKYGIKNLYGGDKFFDKEATIDEFIKLCPEKLGSYNTYDELYADALQNIGHVSFYEKTRDYDGYFHLLNNQDKLSAIALGVLAYYLAKEIDSNGDKIEKGIDKAVSWISKDGAYDVNNPFDTKTGLGHRMFGHDPFAFAFKNIPTNYLVYVPNEAVPNTRKIIPVGKFLGLSEDVKYVSMIDIIWKYYGNESNILKGILNSIGHTIVHFAKDLFTPDGLPIPFTSLLEKYQRIDDSKYQVLRYRDSFYKMSNDVHLRASDFTSLALIELFSKIYCESSDVDDEKIAGYKDDFKIIAISTCIAIQVSGIVFRNESQSGSKGPTKLIDGAKINLPLLTCYMNIVRKEAVSIYRKNNEIKSFYQERKR